MHRDPAHGNIRALVFAAFCKSDIERLRRRYSIVKKQLIKISHAIEQQGGGVFLLDLKKLCHHGRDRLVGLAHRLISICRKY